MNNFNDFNLDVRNVGENVEENDRISKGFITSLCVTGPLHCPTRVTLTGPLHCITKVCENKSVN